MAAKKDHIARYAFKVPLLFEGDRGSGKTYDVREFARAGKHPYVEIAGHESVEAIDFLGHHMQSPMGMVWKDGHLSRAFRQAAGGQKVALLIDEMLRIPQRHLSVLLSALSPDSTGHYRLQTGRMVDVVDGVGVEEEILCPSSNLAIFATTNVGPEFAIDDLDPAVAERFIIVRKDTEKATLEAILRSCCAKRSFSSSCALRLSELFERTKRMVDTGTLNRHATTRTLARAIEHASDEHDVKAVLKDQILLWVDRDSAGRPVENQAKQLERAIDELFPDARPAPAPSSRAGIPASGKSYHTASGASYASAKAAAAAAAKSKAVAYDIETGEDGDAMEDAEMRALFELSSALKETSSLKDFHAAEMAKMLHAHEWLRAKTEADRKEAMKAERSVSKPSSAPKADSDRVELVKGERGAREYLVHVTRSSADPKLWALETSRLSHDRRKVDSRQSSPTSYSAAASSMIGAKKTALAAGFRESEPAKAGPSKEEMIEVEIDLFGEEPEAENPYELSRRRRYSSLDIL